MNAASEGVEITRKKVGPTTGLSTNMEMLLNYLKLYLSIVSSEAVQVVEEVRVTNGQAETPATQKDPIMNNEGGRPRWRWRRCCARRRSTKPRW